MVKILCRKAKESRSLGNHINSHYKTKNRCLRKILTTRSLTFLVNYKFLKMFFIFKKKQLKKMVLFLFVFGPEPHHFREGITLCFQSKPAHHPRFLESSYLTFDLAQPLTQASGLLSLQWPYGVIVPVTPQVVVLEWGCLNLDSSSDT